MSGPVEEEQGYPMMQNGPSPQPQQTQQQDQNPITSRYRKVLEEPEPDMYDEKYKPGIMRRIAGALRGAGGDPEGGRAFVHEPYLADVSRRRAMLGDLEKGSKIEQDMGNTAFDRDIKKRTTAVAERNAASLEGNRKSLAESRAARILVQKHKMENPNHKIIKTEGGNWVSVNPETNETVDLGIPTGTMSEEDELELKQTGVLQAIAARGAQARTTQAEGNEQELGRISARGEENRTTKQTAPAIADSSTESTAEINEEGTKVTRKTKRTNTKPVKTSVRVKTAPKTMTDRDGNVYDISTWSAKDIEEAKKAGFK